MLPKWNFAGIQIDVYNMMFFLGLVSVALILILLRKKFGYNRRQSVFYAAFTLAFGFFSAMITAWLENGLLSLVSNGEYDHFENLRNYGIPMFLPVFLWIYCLLCREPFRTLSDYIAPCVYSVMTFVKTGCCFAGCCRGEADPNGIWNEELGYRTFPVQVYDALSSLVIVMICFVLWATLRKKRQGYIYPIGGMLFALTKGFWEIFRVHSTVWEKNFMNTGWTFWQFWMAILFAGCLIWLLGTVVREKKKIPDYNEMEQLRLPEIPIRKFFFPASSDKKKNGKKQPIVHAKKRRKK